MTPQTDTTPSQLDDVAVVRGAQRGDRASLAMLIQRHQHAVNGYLAARLPCGTDADDLTQEVFIRCYLGRAVFREGSQVRAWLLGVARNVLREHLRKLRRRKEVAWTEICIQYDEQSLNKPCPLEQDELIEQLSGCLQALNENAQKALQLRYASQLRMAEIGSRLRRSEGAVKVLVHRARQALKHCLTGSGQS